MPLPTNTTAIATATVRVIVDVSQEIIIQNRRKLREQMLKQLGQRTSKAEQNIERLMQLTQ
jgi:hypothetical protein